MTIYTSEGLPILDAIVTSAARHEQELMKSDFIALEWNDDTYRSLPSGAYIMPFGDQEGDPHYTLYADYEPENNNGVYVYKPEFQAPCMILAHTPCLFKTNNSQEQPIKQVDWVYTGNLQLIVGHIITIIFEELAKHLEAVIKIKSTTSLPASATCTFSGVDIMSALNEICSQFGGLDWHVDWEGGLLYIGDVTAGGDEYVIDPETGKLVPRQDGGTTPAQLTEGDNVQFASVNRNGQPFANYFIVRGGTRNITIQTQSGNHVQTDTRLVLNPTLYPNSVMDERTDKQHEPKVQKILIFDNVYPHLNLYAYNIRKRTRILTDEKTGAYVPKSYNQDGTVKEFKTYSIYYMRLAYPTNEEMTTWKDYRIQDPKTAIMNGRKLTCSFEPNEDGTHSALAGREFELAYHQTAQSYTHIDSKVPNTLPLKEDTGVNILADDYEIIFTEDNEMIIPNDDTLEPWGMETPNKVNDIVVLFNIVMDDTYITKAQQDLKTAAQNEIARILTDDNNYTVKSNPVAFNTSNPNLTIGSSVDLTLQNGTVMNTRVIKLVTNIDYPCQQEITVGNAVIKGSTQVLKEDVKTLTAAIDINENSATTINKMISQLYRLMREYDTIFLHKNNDDETPFTLGANALNVENQAILGSLQVLADAIMKGNLETEHYNKSMVGGTGWGVDHAGNMQVESLEVRSALRVLELVYNRLSAEESDYIFTEAGTIKSVTSTSTANQYTLVMEKRNETDFHAFRDGDILKGVVNDLTNLGGGNYYTCWLEVVGTDTSIDQETSIRNNSITVKMCANSDCPSETNYPPKEHMVVHRWGNKIAPNAQNKADQRYSAFIDLVDGEYTNRRQSCWYISSTEKRIVMLDHVNCPKIAENNYAAFFGLPFELSTFKGHYMNKTQPYLYVRGAFLQDIYFIDYLGHVIKQERFRGVWDAETAASNDPYCVTETTYDTVYHDQAKWRCLVEIAVNPPSAHNTEWELLQAAVDATFYRLIPSQASIKRDNEGYPYVRHLNVVAERIEGRTATILPDDNVYMIINGIEIRHDSSIELQKDDGIETVEFLLLPDDGAKFDSAQFDNEVFAQPLATTTVSIVSDGKDGASGSGIDRIAEQYGVSANSNTEPSLWTTLAAATQSWNATNKYLWNKETTTYTGGKLPESRSHIICVYSEDGRGITSVTNYYKASSLSSGETRTSTGWNTNPALAVLTSTNKYLWNFESILFSDGNEQMTDPAVIGVYSTGAKGDRGAILRGPTEWKTGIRYEGGNEGDDYQDIVARTVEGVTTFYLCHYTHTSNNNNDPYGHSHNTSPWTSSEPWQASQVGDFVATKVLFAERAVIENVDIRGTITSETLYVDSSAYDGSADNNLYIANTGRSITLAPMRNTMVVLPLLNDFVDEDTGWSIAGYGVAGTHIQIHTEPLLDVCNWAASDITTWSNQSEEDLYKLMQYSTLVCADPYVLIEGDSVTKSAHSFGGESLWTTGNYCQGRFSARGMISRFVLVPPGQTLSLTSSKQTMRVNGVDVDCLVWEIDNASDFDSICMRMVSKHYAQEYVYGQSSNEHYEFQGGVGGIQPDTTADWIYDNFLSYKGLDFKVYNSYETEAEKERNSMQIVLYTAGGGGGSPLDPPMWKIAAQKKEDGVIKDTRFWKISSIVKID